MSMGEDAMQYAAKLNQDSRMKGFTEAMNIDDPQQRIMTYLLACWWGKFQPSQLAALLEVSVQDVLTFCETHNLAPDEWLDDDWRFFAKSDLLLNS